MHGFVLISSLNGLNSFNCDRFFPWQSAQAWDTSQVVAWLEREGLSGLCALAGEQGFDGSILLALYEVRMDATTFKSDCTDLGIPAGAIQIKLKGKLVTLFG